MDESHQTPNWQPISLLPQIAEMIDGMLTSAQEVLGSLEQARTRPHVMDDYTLGRVRDVPRRNETEWRRRGGGVDLDPNGISA